MLTEFQKKWVEALRSGKYEQGHGRLRKYNQYCCLGVACDLLGPEYWNGYIYKNCTWVPSGEILDEIGISGQFADDLILMNDDDYKDFNKIADFIEAELSR